MKTKSGDLIRLLDDDDEYDESNYIPIYSSIHSRIKTIGKFNSKSIGLVIQTKINSGYQYSRILTSEGEIGWVLNMAFQIIT